MATRYETPRSVADGPKTGDVNKCQRKAPAREDYPLTFTDADFARLQEIFPTGVCDWSKPGVGQQGAIPWMTYQRRSGKVVYGGRALGRRPLRRGSGLADRLSEPRARARRSELAPARRERLAPRGRTASPDQLDHGTPPFCLEMVSGPCT